MARKFTKYPSNYVRATHNIEYNTYWRDYDKVIGTILEFLRLKSGPISQKELYDYLHTSGFPNIDPETVGKAWDHALSIYQSELSDDADIEACGSIDCSTRIQADSEYGRNPTFPNERFEFKIWDPDMYYDIMEAIDDCCSSSMGQLYSQYFTIEGPYEERFDVIDILKDFGVDWNE